MKELSVNEAKSINGGEVPTSYYMDSDTIAQNGKIMGAWIRFVGKVVTEIVPIVLAKYV
ncbi:MAG TPA: hypothetical protein PKM69_06520 [Bacteroidales bacterium]|nr:hypothetical protein [Bacteroidales bacterium]